MHLSIKICLIDRKLSYLRIRQQALRKLGLLLALDPASILLTSLLLLLILDKLLLLLEHLELLLVARTVAVDLELGLAQLQNVSKSVTYVTQVTLDEKATNQVIRQARQYVLQALDHRRLPILVLSRLLIELERTGEDH
jgi:hypothetical protein